MRGCTVYVTGQDTAARYRDILQGVVFSVVSASERARAKTQRLQLTFAFTVWTDPAMVNMTVDTGTGHLYAALLQPNVKSWYSDTCSAVGWGPRGACRPS